jgi:hypothetical protein
MRLGPFDQFVTVASVGAYNPNGIKAPLVITRKFRHPRFVAAIAKAYPHAYRATCPRVRDLGRANLQPASRLLLLLGANAMHDFNMFTFGP